MSPEVRESARRRMVAWRARARASGLRPVHVWVPADTKEELRRFVEWLCGREAAERSSIVESPGRASSPGGQRSKKAGVAGRAATHA